MKTKFSLIFCAMLSFVKSNAQTILSNNPNLKNIIEFEKQVTETHKNNDKYRKEYLAIIEVVKIKFDLK